MTFNCLVSRFTLTGDCKISAALAGREPCTGVDAKQGSSILDVLSTEFRADSWQGRNFFLDLPFKRLVGLWQTVCKVPFFVGVTSWFFFLAFTFGPPERVSTALGGVWTFFKRTKIVQGCRVRLSITFNCCTSWSCSSHFRFVSFGLGHCRTDNAVKWNIYARGAPVVQYWSCNHLADWETTGVTIGREC